MLVIQLGSEMAFALKLNNMSSGVIYFMGLFCLLCISFFFLDEFNALLYARGTLAVLSTAEDCFTFKVSVLQQPMSFFEQINSCSTSFVNLNLETFFSYSPNAPKPSFYLV